MVWIEFIGDGKKSIEEVKVILFSIYYMLGSVRY